MRNDLAIAHQWLIGVSELVGSVPDIATIGDNGKFSGGKSGGSRTGRAADGSFLNLRQRLSRN